MWSGCPVKPALTEDGELLHQAELLYYPQAGPAGCGFLSVLEKVPPTDRRPDPGFAQAGSIASLVALPGIAVHPNKMGLLDFRLTIYVSPDSLWLERIQSFVN